LHAHHFTERATTIDVSEQEFVSTVTIHEKNRTVTEAGLHFDCVFRRRRPKAQVREKCGWWSWWHSDGSVITRDAQGRGYDGRVVADTPVGTSGTTFGVNAITATTFTTTATTTDYQVQSRAGARGRLRFFRLCGQRRFGRPGITADPRGRPRQIGRRWV